MSNLDDAFDSARTVRINEKKLREQLQTLTEAAAEVRELWGQIEGLGGRVEVKDYPFDHNFDTVTDKLMQIRDRLVVTGPTPAPEKAKWWAKCPKHGHMPFNSGSCHECAMLQPPTIENLRETLKDLVATARLVVERWGQRDLVAAVKLLKIDADDAERIANLVDVEDAQ